MKIADILQALNEWAPLAYQESYDNSGLLVGEAESELTGILVCFDITKGCLAEAEYLGCNLIISHHPIIFGGMTKLTGSTPEERIVMQALRRGIHIIAMHTNLDNMHHGVNHKIAELIGLEQTHILQPMPNVLRKLSVFVPSTHAEAVKAAVFAAGAGHIGSYDQCGFSTIGEGSYRPLEGSQPFVGSLHKTEQAEEIRFETIYPKHVEGQLIAALLQAHPYEEVAYDIYPLHNTHKHIGAGMWGYLPQAMPEKAFMSLLKEVFEVGAIKHTIWRNKEIHKVAFCGGSGAFLIDKALSIGADIFFTGDIKYHDYFKANEHTIIADIGHYESEQYTTELIQDFLRQRFPKYAVRTTRFTSKPTMWF